MRNSFKTSKVFIAIKECVKNINYILTVFILFYLGFSGLFKIKFENYLVIVVGTKKKSEKRFFTRQVETVFFVILLLSVMGISLIPLINDIFPNNGGFTRNILFVKSNPNGAPGYFIIIDELNPTSNKIPVDWILHGRGNLSVFNNNQSAVWTVKSYLNPDNIIKLHAIFVAPQVLISQSTGPFYPTQSYVDNPVMIPYIKARPTQPGPTRIVTILFPLNGSQTLPAISTNSTSGVTHIGENDLLFSQNSAALSTFENFTTNAETLFLRLNHSEIFSFVLQKGNFLSYHDQMYLESDHLVSLNLEYQSSNISGMLWIPTATTLALWVPKTPKQTLFNGNDFIGTYNPANQTLFFTIAKNGSLFISFDPVKCSPPSNLSSLEPLEETFLEKGFTKSYGAHPFLYFTQSELEALRNRVLSNDPWREWFALIEKDATSHLVDNIAGLDPDARIDPALNLAFTGVIKQNMTFITKAKQFLQAMDQVTDTDYFSHLRRASACSYYSIAYDMIYQNLSAAERVEIADKLGNHTLLLDELLDIVPRNNHIGVTASGLGLAGLVLGRSTWVDRAVSAIDGYFNTSFGSEGGIYEGFSYGGYFLEHALSFFYGLKNAGEKNYFADSRLIALINATIYSLSPLTTVPFFEDTECYPQVIEDLLWVAPHIYPAAPQLSNYCQWVYNKRLLNDQLHYDGKYLNSIQNWTYTPFASEFQYILGPLVTRTCMYSMNITPVQPPLATALIWPDSGIAFFRSDWEPDALYFSITCKSKSDNQYHAHYDENSFELWAFGAWLATNPGYPGYGYGEYDLIVSTEASNTLLMNDKGQQQVNGEGFQEYYFSSEIDGVVASAQNIYSSPGSFATNEYFLGVLIFIFVNLALASLIMFSLRHRAYKAKVIFLPDEHPSRVSAIKSTNLALKVHFILLFGLISGVISALVSFFLFTNFYVQDYIYGKHETIANLIPYIEMFLLIFTILAIIFLISFKLKMQKGLLRRIIGFSVNLKISKMPLDNSVKRSYLPQILFLLIFIPIIFFLYTPLLEDIVNFIFTRAGSLIAIQNYIIGTLNRYILLFAFTLLMYLPFKLYGLYLGGRSISDQVRQPTSDGFLMLAASYLLTITLIILLVFYLTLFFFYILNFLGVAFVV